MYNAKYHCRFIEKESTMNIKKYKMIAFMSKHDIEIPNPNFNKVGAIGKNYYNS